MTVTAFWYANAILAAFTQPAGSVLDLDTDSIKCMLTTNSYSPNQDTHNRKDDVTNEVVGTGYTAGGKALTGKVSSLTLNVFTFDADDLTWPGSTLTARRAVFYDDAGATDADKPLLCWIDFGADFSTANGTFTIAFGAGGVAQVTAANAAGFP